MSPKPNRKSVLGIIGGIGSGKSQVAEELIRRGARVLSGDKFGHEALRQPSIRDAVVQRWGKAVLDENNEINRRQLAALVFADAAERHALEELVFPWIERRFHEEIAAAENDGRIALIALDAAVLLEAGWNKMCDWIVYVHAPRLLRLQRLAKQRGWSAKEVEAREHAQLSLTDKVTRADAVVDNSGTPVQLAQQVDALHPHWLQRRPRSKAPSTVPKVFSG